MRIERGKMRLEIAVLIVLVLFLDVRCSLEKLDPGSSNCSPTVRFTVDQKTCIAPCTINFSNTTNAQNVLDFEWFIDDVSQGGSLASFTFESGGTYSVKLAGTCKSDNSISDSFVEEIEIADPASAIADFSFSPSNCVVPCTVSFMDSSQNADSWSWNFGDASSGDNQSNDQNPMHTYNEIGEYTVTLSVSNDNSTDEISKMIKVDIPTYFKIEGGSGSDKATSLIATSDGFFVITGNTNSMEYVSSPSNHLMLWKFDDLGAKVWSDPVVLKQNSFGHSIIENKDGDYVVVGEEYNHPTDASIVSPIFAILNPANGGTKLFRNTDFPMNDLGNYGSISDILEVGDQYGITGYQELCAPGCHHILLAYVSDKGNIIGGSKSTDSFTGDDARGVSISSSPLDVVSFGNQDGELILRENRENDALFKSKRFTDLSGNQTAHQILGQANGDFLLLAETDMGPKGGIDVMFFSVDNNFERNMEPVYFGGSRTDRATSMVAFDDGYVLAGSSNSDNADGSFDIYLIKIDEKGGMIWETKYKVEDTDEFAEDIRATEDGGLIITGYIEYADNTTDIFLMKTNSQGEVLQ